MWGYAILPKKKKTFVVISQNGSCEFSGNESHVFINNLLGDRRSCMSEGVYQVPSDVEIETILADAGFVKDEPQAVRVLEYMKERGSLR